MKRDLGRTIESPSHEAHDLEELVLQLQGDLDFTKHLGGQAATERLVDLCRIDASKYVLDIGCGVGITPCNWLRALALTLRREYRGVIREALADPTELIQYWGDGVYFGRKLSVGRRLLPTSVST